MWTTMAFCALMWVTFSRLDFKTDFEIIQKIAQIFDCIERAKHMTIGSNFKYLP